MPKPKTKFTNMTALERAKEAFTEAGAPHLMDFLIGHAMNDPTTARWLAERLLPLYWPGTPPNKDADLCG